MEVVYLSTGTWADLVTLLSLSTETQRSEDVRWYSVPSPQYQVLYSGSKPIAVRLMGTMLELRGDTNAG